MECIGCRLANEKEPVYVVFEDDYISCFLDHEPFNEGHVLILPKSHILDADELDESTADSIMKASMFISKAIKKLYKPDGITICQNGGVFNELTHYHMHVVPRYKDQPFATFYMEGEQILIEDPAKLRETQSNLSEAIREVIGSK
ncbi:HIT family protein [Paenisporosarcina quisquiliarum]|uniref:HIT family protein n=1 Tax=Paenisporosarcina quisquiliarum TaxID=365346 RepID=UPI003735CE5D